MMLRTSSRRTVNPKFTSEFRASKYGAGFTSKYGTVINGIIVMLMNYKKGRLPVIIIDATYPQSDDWGIFQNNKDEL